MRCDALLLVFYRQIPEKMKSSRGVRAAVRSSLADVRARRDGVTGFTLWTEDGLTAIGLSVVSLSSVAHVSRVIILIR